MSEDARTREARRHVVVLRRAVLRLASGAALVLMVSCAKDRSVDYAAYERIPIRPASAALRMVATSTPSMRKAIFYGNYGGPGNIGGKPVDEMDELFRRHDIVYSLARTRKTMVAADHALLEGLSSLDASTMNAEAVGYCGRVFRFFKSPISHVFGKPLSTLYTVKERRGCYFQSLDVVRGFFSKEHSGVPEGGGGREGVGRGLAANRE